MSLLGSLRVDAGNFSNFIADINFGSLNSNLRESTMATIIKSAVN